MELYEAKQEEQNLIKEKEIQELKARNENRRKSLKRTNVNSHKVCTFYENLLSKSINIIDAERCSANP